MRRLFDPESRPTSHGSASRPTSHGSADTISLHSHLLDEVEGNNKKTKSKKSKKTKKTFPTSLTSFTILSDSMLSLQTPLKYRKLKEEDAMFPKLRKQVAKCVDEDDLERLLKLIEDANRNLSEALSGEVKTPITFESSVLSDRRTHMTILHSALEENRPTIAIYLIENCFIDYLFRTYTNFESQIPPSCKSCLHVLAEHGNLELMERFMVRLRSSYPKMQCAFEALVHPVVDKFQLDKVVEFTKLKVVTKVKDMKRRMTAVHLAVVNNHPKLFKLMKKYEIDLNAEDDHKETPLMWAIILGHKECFDELMRLKADANLQNQFNCSSLHLTVTCRQLDMAETLIQEGNADLNLERIKNPRWVVEMVASHNDVQLMKKLMEPSIKCKINKPNIIEALFIAAKEGHDGIIEEILKADNTLVNAEDDLKNTPLMAAMESGKLSVVKVLVEKFSADLTHKNNLRETVYDMAMRQQSIEFLKYLMEQSQGDHMLNPQYLHLAAASGDAEKIDFILLKGSIKPLELDINNNTIFHTAAAHNASGILDYFLAKDDDLTDLQNKEGETPLHVAVKRGHADCVKTLLAKNARVDIGDNSNQNALHAAVASSSTDSEIISLLVQRMKETYVTTLNDQDKDGNTALHLAANYCSKEFIKILADLDPEVENVDGETPLHTAVRHGSAKEVRTLLKLFYNTRERNIDRKDENDITPLMRSAELGDSEKFDLLMSFGADMTLRGYEDCTILHKVISSNRKNLALSDRYVSVYHSIVKWSVKWYCRKEGLRCPLETSPDYSLYQLNAVRYLTSEMFYQKCNALQYASKLGTGDLLKAMLRTPDVYKFTFKSSFSIPFDNNVNLNKSNYKDSRILANFLEDNKRSNDMVLYDVSYLIPISEPKQSDPLTLEVDIQSGTKVISTETPRKIKSCLECIVGTNDEYFINDVLDGEPFNFLVSKYWTLCRRCYEVLMWAHVLYMVLFTYFVMPSSDFLKYRFDYLNDTSDPKINHLRFESVNIFGTFLIWPFFILTYEIFMGMYYISSLRKRTLSIRKGLFGKFKVGEITSGFMRIPVGMMLFIFDNLSHISSLAFGISSLVWFVMATHCSKSHDYLESLAVVLIFGWLHTINYVKGFKDWNALASILKQILIKDITCFIYIYIFVLISFGYAIHVLIQADYDLNPDYRHSTSTIYLTFYRMLSPGNVLDVSEDSDYAKSGGRVSILRTVCAAYSVLSSVVLMNLLIAMMNSTYSEIKSNKSTAWRIDSLKMALWFEQHLSCLRRWNVLGFSAKLDPGQNRWYLSRKTVVNLDEEFWVTNKKEKLNGDEEGKEETESKKVRKQIEATEKFTSILESLGSQMGALREELADNSYDNRQIKNVVSDLRMEIKRIHELSLETCTLSKLTRRIEDSSDKREKH